MSQHEYSEVNGEILCDGISMSSTDILFSLRKLNDFNHLRKLPENYPKSIELKPCPFCGKEIKTQDMMDTIYPIDREKSVYQVVCGDCSATVLGWTREEAIRWWNYRKNEIAS